MALTPVTTNGRKPGDPRRREYRVIIPVLSRQVHRNRIDILRAVEVRVRRGRRVAVEIRTIPRGLHLNGLTRKEIHGSAAGPWTRVGQ